MVCAGGQLQETYKLLLQRTIIREQILIDRNGDFRLACRAFTVEKEVFLQNRTPPLLPHQRVCVGDCQFFTRTDGTQGYHSHLIVASLENSTVWLAAVIEDGKLGK